MSDFITLSCPSCGGKLEITKDVERFACAHCGNEHVVKRGGGIVSLAPVMEGLQKVQASTDKVGAELAIQRLTAELAESGAKLDRAKAKARTAGNPPKTALSLLLFIGLFLVAAWFLIDAGIALFRAGMSDAANVFCPGALFLVAGVLSAAILAVRQNGIRSTKIAAQKATAELTTAEATHNNIRDELARQRQLTRS